MVERHCYMPMVPACLTTSFQGNLKRQGFENNFFERVAGVFFQKLKFFSIFPLQRKVQALELAASLTK